MVPAGNKVKRPSSVNHTTKQFIIIITQKGRVPSEKGSVVPTLEETVPDAAVITDFDK